MLISFVASYMFTLNNYLPMIGCISAASLGFVLSVLMKDYSPHNKLPYNKKEKTKVKIKYSKFIIITVIVYSVFYAVVSSGQNEGKLFIQEHLFLDFDENKTALILGAIICVTRVVRVISNVIFAKIYKKCQEKFISI
jgi:archaellum biogenesis protein FlaJ (TadC family)